MSCSVNASAVSRPDVLMAFRDLTQANTLRLPCVAEQYAAPTTLAALRDVLHQAGQQRRPMTLLGGGSNVLLPSQLSGVVIRPSLQQWWLERRGREVLVYVGAGVNWHALVMALAARGLWGCENLALIPGDCGAAPVQNIGAYGVELADVLAAVQVVELATGGVRWLDGEACQFGYRDSLFKRDLAGKVVITQLVLRLSETPNPQLGYGDLAARVSAAPDPLEVARAVCAIRQEKLPDPAVLANAGSFFKNPLVSGDHAQRLLSDYPGIPHFPQPDGQVKLAAGWLIDQCGLKGHRQGAFGVHQHQALVLVHFGGGNRAELLAFADVVAGAVAERFGVSLEAEPRVIS